MNCENSEYGAIIKRNMLAGAAGPKEITVGLLQSHMSNLSRQGKRVFVLDSFPGDLEQAEHFEKTIAPIKLVIVLQRSETTLYDRLLPGGRFDDKRENIQKRINAFNNVTSEAIKYYRRLQKVKTVDSELDVEVVSSELEAILSRVASRMLAEGTR